MRRAFILLAAVLLLVSCSEMQSHLLSSSEGAEIWLADKDSAVVITAGRDIIDFLAELSGHDSTVALSELFGISAEDTVVIGSAVFGKRAEMLSLLSEATGIESPYLARVRYDEDLADTLYMSEISRLSSSFDTILSEDVITKRDMEFREYRLESILGSPASWEEAADFISVWMKAVERKIG